MGHLARERRVKVNGDQVFLFYLNKIRPRVIKAKIATVNITVLIKLTEGRE